MSVFAVERQRRFSSRWRLGLANALLLLSDIRHRFGWLKCPLPAGPQRVAADRIGLHAPYALACE